MQETLAGQAFPAHLFLSIISRLFLPSFQSEIFPERSSHKSLLHVVVDKHIPDLILAEQFDPDILGLVEMLLSTSRAMKL